VVINGELAGCCTGRGPDEHVIRQANSIATESPVLSREEKRIVDVLDARESLVVALGGHRQTLLTTRLSFWLRGPCASRP
jgi:hypothetical protein